MFESILEAARNFCIHQLGCTPVITKEIPENSEKIITSIEVSTPKNERYDVYIVAEKVFVQRIATIFLEETHSDEETLKDMAMECTNLIVGNAKVIAAEEMGISLEISTPKLQNIESLQSLDGESVILECDETKLYISMQKTKG